MPNSNHRPIVKLALHYHGLYEVIKKTEREMAEAVDAHILRMAECAHSQMEAALRGKHRFMNQGRIVQCVNACIDIEDPDQALGLVRTALEKILRHIPDNAGGASVSADVDLCKQALKALGVKSA